MRWVLLVSSSMSFCGRPENDGGKDWVFFSQIMIEFLKHLSLHYKLQVQRHIYDVTSFVDEFAGPV